MKETTVSIKQLIDVISKNREKHRINVQSATAKWREEMVQVLKKNLDIIERNSSESLEQLPERPDSHLDEYDRAIKMLTMSVEESTTISSQEFAAFVEDEWHWKRGWQLRNSKYID